MKNIKETLLKLFETNGIVIQENEQFTDLELDSLRFISLIINIEDKFEITIPDEYLSGNSLNTFSDFSEVISIVKNSL